MKDERQKNIWDNMPLPKKTNETRQKSKLNLMFCRTNLWSFTSETVPIAQNPVHHPRRIPRTTIFPRQKLLPACARDEEGDTARIRQNQGAVAHTEIVLQPEGAR